MKKLSLIVVLASMFASTAALAASAQKLVIFNIKNETGTKITFSPYAVDQHCADMSPTQIACTG